MNATKTKFSNKSWVFISLGILYCTVLILTAWISDDAYITFRNIDNFINGFGLTWNIGERVQAFTHPLWMFVLSGFVFTTREFFFTSIIISIIVSLLTFFILLNKISINTENSILFGLILIFSKAFVDYSTSGLENPLTHLLLVLFFVSYFNQTDYKKKLLQLSFVSALAALNRSDIIIILLPLILFVYWQETDKLKNILFIVLGFLPLIAWEVFSLFYYGFPFPNTAYAKLNTGINQPELIKQGFLYLQDSIYMDPLTLIALVSGLVLGFFKREKKLLPITIGILLYVIYVINIGGDFMSGRFFTAPLLCSVIIISRIRIKSSKAVLAYSLVIILFGFLSPRPNFLSSPYYSLGPKIIHAFLFGPAIIGMNNGITDERFWYYENTGLLNNIFEKKIEQHPWVEHALRVKESRNNLVVKSSLGLFGFYAGRNTKIVDQYALTEPLLSKLPSTEYWLIDHERPKGEKFWRIGHFPRKIPDGYLETLKSGKNVITDPNLARYYEKLTIIIKGNLWDWNRLKEIWNFNAGIYNYLLRDYIKLSTFKKILSNLYM